MYLLCMGVLICGCGHERNLQLQKTKEGYSAQLPCIHGMTQTWPHLPMTHSQPTHCIMGICTAVSYQVGRFAAKFASRRCTSRWVPGFEAMITKQRCSPFSHRIKTRITVNFCAWEGFEESKMKKSSLMEEVGPKG